MLAKLKQYLADTNQAVVWAFKHPATARKAVLTFVTHLALVWGGITAAFPQISATHSGIFAAVTAALTGAVTFLTSNKVIAVTDAPPVA